MLAEDRAAGRFCPSHYQLSPSMFKQALAGPVDVLYCVGGLYGNTEAAASIEALFQSEPAARKALVLNGDFHWFDLASSQFSRIEAFAARHIALRGNVETELGSADASAGCGCAYPATVSDAEVERSNRILGQLRHTARALGAGPRLASLPCAGYVMVGDQAVGITHGDHESLSGWSLAHDALDLTMTQGLLPWLDTQRLSGLCSSHTCLPVARTDPTTGRFVINNGSAGMANFAGDHRGLITRISTPAHGLMQTAAGVRYAAQTASLHIAALAVDFDLGVWTRLFESQWPQGSAAHVSYFRRICEGPHYAAAQAMGAGFSEPALQVAA